MAVEAGTAVSLSESYFLRYFYKDNRDARTASKRCDFSQGTLSKADATALHRAVRRLRNFNYDKNSDDGANIYSSVSAFVETYNNAMNSAGNSDDVALERYAKNLKSLSTKYADELEDIGITLNSDGTLKKNDNRLKAAGIDEVKKLFSEDAGYRTGVYRYAKRMIEKATNLIATEAAEKNAEAAKKSALAEQTAVAALINGLATELGDEDSSSDSSALGKNIDILL